MALLPGFSPDCAVIDLRLDGESGLVVAQVLRERVSGIRILILTGYGSIATALDAVRLGATHYLAKPADVHDILAAFERERSAPIEPTPAVAFQAPSAREIGRAHV